GKVGDQHTECIFVDHATDVARVPLRINRKPSPSAPHYGLAAGRKTDLQGARPEGHFHYPNQLRRDACAWLFAPGVLARVGAFAPWILPLPLLSLQPMGQ